MSGIVVQTPAGSAQVAVKRPQPESSPASQAITAASGAQPKKATTNRPANPTWPARIRSAISSRAGLAVGGPGRRPRSASGSGDQRTQTEPSSSSSRLAVRRTRPGRPSGRRSPPAAARRPRPSPTPGRRSPRRRTRGRRRPRRARGRRAGDGRAAGTPGRACGGRRTPWGSASSTCRSTRRTTCRPPTPARTARPRRRRRTSSRASPCSATGGRSPDDGSGPAAARRLVRRRRPRCRWRARCRWLPRARPMLARPARSPSRPGRGPAAGPLPRVRAARRSGAGRVRASGAAAAIATGRAARRRPAAAGREPPATLGQHLVGRLDREESRQRRLARRVRVIRLREAAVGAANVVERRAGREAKRAVGIERLGHRGKCRPGRLAAPPRLPRRRGGRVPTGSGRSTLRRTSRAAALGRRRSPRRAGGSRRRPSRAASRSSRPRPSRTEAPR